MELDVALYADALLLMGALGLALYCLMLQRQLRKLQRTDRGIGKAIDELSLSTRLSQQAARDLKNQIGQALTEIDTKLATLRGRRVEIDDVLDAVDGQVNLQMRRCEDARTLTEQALRPLLERAELEIQALTAAIEVSARLSKRASIPEPAAAPAPVAHPHADNPFLRAVNG